MKIDIKAPEKDKITQALKNDQIVITLLGMSYPAIDSWVDTNITTLSDMRGVIKRLIKFMVFLIRHLKITIS
jgi:predicted nucleotide-binding protein (sugar kinase/HSP70/actin superfamily)